MASTTWRIQGVDTQGNDLVLSRISPWAANGAAVPLSITSTFPPVSGAVENLLVDDGTECTFAAEDVQKPGFAIAFTFAAPVDLWGFRFAGPSATTWPQRHVLSDGVQACSLSRVEWAAGVQSPAPSHRPVFTQEAGVWVAQQATGTRQWHGCAVSADGQVLLAGTSTSGNLVLSKDGGATWVAQTAPGSRTWRGCAVSGDGLVLLAGSFSGSLWLSKDSGATWVEQTAAGSRQWQSCGVSADGQVLLSGANSSNLVLSKDGGATWVAQAAPGSGTWTGCAVSGDGLVLLAGSFSGSLWLSKDGGVTWAPTSAGSRQWQSCGVSADGQVLLAGTNGTTLWLSKDGGTTWVAQAAPGSNTWYSCGVSGDGQVLLAGTISTALWLSKDGGATWLAQVATGNNTWYGCAVSADGQVLFAGASAGGSLWLLISSDPIYLPNGMRTFSSQVLIPIKGAAPDPQGTLNTFTTSVVQVVDTEFGGNGRVYGTVERKNTPANVPMRRRVRLHRSRDGLLVRETWSKADGTYEFKGISMQYEYDTIAWDNEMSYRSVVANNLKPEAM